MNYLSLEFSVESPLSIALPELEFLRSPTGQSLLLQGRGKDALQLSTIYKDLNIEQRRSLTEYLSIQSKIAKKFQTTEFLLLDHLAYEQSTAADLSKWKTSLIQNSPLIADLCCGLGADSLFLPMQIPVIGVDLSPERCLMFSHNQQVLRPQAKTLVVQADVSHVPLRQMDLWFCDPDRRGGERHGQWDPSQMRPTFTELQQLLKQCPQAFLKLPPSTDYKALPWKDHVRYSYLGDRHSCRELLVELGRPQKELVLRAVQVDQNKYLECQPQDLPKLHLGNISLWIFEPSPTAIRSQLHHQLAHQHKLWTLDTSIPYLFGEEFVESDFLSAYQILDAFSYDKKNVKRKLHSLGAGEVVVKKRGLDINPDLLAKEWRGKGTERLVVFISTFNQRQMAIIAKKP